MYCTKCKADNNKRLSYIEHRPIALVSGSICTSEKIVITGGYIEYRFHINADGILLGEISTDSKISQVSFEKSIIGSPEYDSIPCFCKYLFPRTEGQTKEEIRDEVLEYLHEFFNNVFYISKCLAN